MHRFWMISGVLLAVGCVDGQITSDEEASTITSTEKGADKHERFLYIATINAGGSGDPDMVTLVGVNPGKEDYGKIVKRIDMPNVGDELHHFGYSEDRSKLLVPGLFTGRMYVYDVEKPLSPALTSTADLTTSGYIVPHTVISQHDGTALVTMIGSLTDTTIPGGVIRIDEETGEFIETFGPGPDRDPSAVGPKYMYDFHANKDINRAVSTTFGAPADLAGGINPAGLGDEIAVWDVSEERVIQTINLGANSGALEARWVEEEGSTYGYTNTPGTGAVWLWEDEDGDGFFNVHQVLSPADGLVIPVDMLLSDDMKYMYITNWMGNTVQMFDITDRYNPVKVDEVSVPHPNMVRLSPDGKRLYVTNSLLSSWDNDTNFGPARNTDYGLWLYYIDENGMTSHTADNSAWVDFDAIEKASGIGPAGPHMMLFDPSVEIREGHH